MKTRHLACAALLLFSWRAAGQREIYFTPFSHLDFFWGGTREECLSRGNGIIAKVIELARASEKFHFLLEDNVFVANYVETHGGTAELEELKKLVRAGRIEIAPKWAAIFQGLPDGEAHARNMALGKRYARQVFGVDPQVAHLGDLPDYTPQFPQILRQSRVANMVMTRMGPSDVSLFRWRGLDGSQALVWNTLKGYGWGTFLTSVAQVDEEKRARFRKDLAEIGATTPGPILMNWGTDLWSPPDDLVARVEEFNRAAGAHLRITTPGQFFERVARESGIPERQGEIPSSWPNIVSSLPHLWPEIIPATNTLLAAEKFAAIGSALGYGAYPQTELEFAWKKLIESMDHNHDGQGGLELGDGRKAEYQRLAKIRGGEILRDAMRNIAERVRIPAAGGFPIVVFNPLGWRRDDVVRAHVTLYGAVSPADIGAFKKGMRLLDAEGRETPFHVEEYSENISRAVQVAFVARGVPPVGYRTYYLTAGTGQAFPAAVEVRLDAERDRKDPRRGAGADTIENAFYRVSVDRATGRVTLFDKELQRDVARDMEVSALEERGGNYIGIETLSGRTIAAVVNDVKVEENNAVRAVVRMALQVADIPAVQRLTLYGGLKRLDIENTVEWSRPRFLRLQQLFPHRQAGTRIHYGVPFGANSRENVLPNTGPHMSDEIRLESWQRSRHVHDWIHAGDAEQGLTIATDHQQVRLDEGLIRAEMLRGTRFTSVRVVRGEEVGSMHYPPPGRYVFRYSLSSGRGDWKQAKAYQAGMGLTNPLLAAAVADTVSKKTLAPEQSFCAVEQENLVISAIKKADEGGGLLVRVYEIEGAATRSGIQFLGRRREFTETNLLEEDEPGGRKVTLEVGPYGIRTLRLRLE